MTGSARIIRGNALALPLADSSVDLVVTSPPYFGLRSYQDGGEHYAGQIGAEPTPAEFVDALICATREMVRVLKPSGSIWVNLGDKYAGSNGQSGGPSSSSTLVGTGHRERVGSGGGFVAGGAPTKSLIGIPWRYALRCIDDLGLILRAEVIWAKPNGLPESVTDRVRRSHEVWFHFTKEPRYFSAVDEIRETYTDVAKVRGVYSVGATPATDVRFNEHNPLGKLPGSVWTIPTQPLTVPAELGIDHFAAFPMEWPRRIISGWSPAGVCTACGEGRRPVSTREALSSQGSTLRTTRGSAQLRDLDRVSTTHQRDVLTTVTGYACACPDTTAPTVPSVILDPFGGTGTTALVAQALGRTGISVDMSQDYCRLAEWRTTDRGQMAAALQVEKPEAVDPNQLDLFDGEFEPESRAKPSFHIDPSNRDCSACGYRAQYAIKDGRKCEKCGTARGESDLFGDVA